MAAFVFDLAMTLLDSSFLEPWRRLRQWTQVRDLLEFVRPFQVGTPSPHELPAHLKAKGHSIAIVTSSPRWYAEQLIEDYKHRCPSCLGRHRTAQTRTRTDQHGIGSAWS